MKFIFIGLLILKYYYICYYKIYLKTLRQHTHTHKMDTFLNQRSCNDDYVPWYYYLKPDPYLEYIDAKLEAICAAEELELNGREDDIIRPPFDDDEELFVDSDRIFPDYYTY